MKQSITLILLFFFQLSFSQVSWINYSNNNEITDFVETDEGFWLGSSGGLAYYNPESGIKKYYNRGNSGLPSNSVNDLLALSNGEIWLTTANGICKIDEDEFVLGQKLLTGSLFKTLDEKVIVFNYDRMYIQKEGMEFMQIDYPESPAAIGGVGVDQKTGAIYVFVNNWFVKSYLAVWENNEWAILYSEDVYDSSMVLDKENKIWLINSNGLQHFENGEFIVVPEVVHEHPLRNPRLFVNNENHIVISNDEEVEKIRVWDGVNFEELKYSSNENNQFSQFIKASDYENDLYYGADITEGFYNFTSYEINEPIKLTQSPILSNSVMNTLHKSDGSHILIFPQGIQEIKSGVWSEISLPEDLSGNIRKGFLDKSENLWMHDNNFLWSYKNEEWLEQSLPAEMSSGLELVEFGKNGDIWVQSNLNIARYRNSEWKVFKTIHHGLINSFFIDMKVDPDNGDLWLSSFSGVIHYDGSSWKKYASSPYNFTYALTLGKGGAFARFSDGIYFIKDGEIESLELPPIGSYNANGSKLFYSSQQDELYITGRTILSVLRNDEWTTYSVDDSGIYYSGTNGMNIDLDQNIWMSSQTSGICIFNEDGITSLSIKEKDESNDLMSIRVFPTLMSQDQFFIESDNCGKYEIVISDINGNLLLQKMHYFSENLPVEFNLNFAPQNIFLVTVSSQNDRITKKLVRYKY